MKLGSNVADPEQNVSIVMPTKDRFQYIERAVRSVQAQTHEKWELIIVDDSVRDTNHRIKELASADSRIRLVHRPAGIGPCAARRLGVEASNGPFVTFLDSDDYYMPDRLNQHVRVWERYPRLGISYDSWRSSEGDEDAYIQRLLRPLPKGISDPPLTARRMFSGNFIHASSGFTKKNIIEDLGGYPASPIVCDWYLYIRICERYPAYRIGVALSVKDSLSPDRVGDIEGIRVTKEFMRARRKLLFGNPRYYVQQFLKETLMALPISVKNRDLKFLRKRLSNLAMMLAE